ncbi:MAG: threonine synthase [Chloroflexia bacterium]
MGTVIELRCVRCGRPYRPDQVAYTCPVCGEDGTLDVLYDYDALRRDLDRERLSRDPEPTMWRYAPLLPVRDLQLAAPLTIGGTPLYRADRLAAALGLARLYIKDDGRNPSASLKDRASAVALVRARETGATVIAAASTGNAASSLACLCAAVGQPCVLLVPETAPPAKVAQLLIFGAQVMLVRGSYDDAFDLCMAACRTYGWYNRNTGINPYLGEGKKTVILEVCEQMGWQVPDLVFVPVGDGCILGSVAKGLRDLLALGWIECMPRLVGVQAEGSAALALAWQRGSAEVEPVVPHTLADSISVSRPRDALKALRAVRESGGAFVTVSDDEILEAMRRLGRETGVFAEPAGAASLAGLIRLAREGKLRGDETAVVLVTGNGLKDVSSALRAVPEPPRIEPTLEALQELLARQGLLKS